MHAVCQARRVVVVVNYFIGELASEGQSIGLLFAFEEQLGLPESRKLLLKLR